MNIFGKMCSKCGEFTGHNTCLNCLTAKTGATVTVGAQGVIVTMGRNGHEL